MTKYDVTVIGSGPGGYIAAIRCAQLGFKTAIIEKYSTLGGTCLNVGCIPSKALLDSSEHYHNAIHNFKEHGIDVKDVKVNFETMIARKADVIKQNCDGINYLMKKNKIDVHTGVGSFKDATHINVSGVDGDKVIETDKVIIATGSKPSTIPGVEIDKKRIITSTEALSLNEIPKTMVLIGGGVIGLELGSVYARLGTKVQVVEYADSIIPTMDKSLGKELLRVLKKQGIEFFLKHSVKSATSKGKKVNVLATDDKGNEVNFEADYCLVAVGRKPFTEGLNAEAAGIKIDERGKIEVNEHLQTSAKNVYAIGDVIKGAMLAHKAEEEGVFVAETLAGQKPHVNYLCIPGVVYTWPEVASVGHTEEELKAKGVEYKMGSIPFKASGRAKASMDTDGFVKVLADKKTDEILGVHMIGPRTADMIAEAVVAMEFKASAEDIGIISHAHPTYTETFKEACLAASDNRAFTNIKMQYRESLEKFPEQLAYSLQNYQSHGVEISDFNNIVLAGLGGSGISAKIIKSYFFDTIKLPIEVISDYHLPQFVNEKTLLILSSYSGNTEETLSVLADGKEKKCTILVLSADGKLLAEAKQNNYTHYVLPKGFQPRMTIGYSLSMLYCLFSELIKKDFKKDIQHAIETLENKENWKTELDKFYSFFKETAKQKFSISSDKYLDATSLRFCQQLNENSKSEAFLNVLPEANHNVIESYYGKLESNFIFIYSQKNPRVSLRFQFLKELLEKNNNKVYSFILEEITLSEIVKLIHIHDWFSVMIAEDQNIDVLNIENIINLKNFLS